MRALDLTKTLRMEGISQVVLVVRNSSANAGDLRNVGSIPGEGNGNLLQYSCLRNPMDRVACGLQSIGLHRVGHD